VKLGVVADIHGNAEALDAVLADAGPSRVDAWWALGDLVLFGPRPAEVLETLAGLPGISYVLGNTDLYVVTGEQPHPHLTAADTVGDVGLIARYAAMAGAIGWTRGALAQSGWLGSIADLPESAEMELPDGSQLMGVHASPGRDDGPGIDSASDDDTLAGLIGGRGAHIVVGGHTHDPTDRVVAGTRALNPGSVGLPRVAGHARWLLIDADEHQVSVELRRVAFDVATVVSDLHERGYPNASFLEDVLSGTRRFGPDPSGR
jgi:predicted phosphodiesterase